MTDGFITMTVESRDELVRAASEKAWDEGGAHVESRDGYYDPDDNPYKIAEC